MSLLLEALKKAEKAKEEAQRRAGENAPAAAAPPQALSLQAEEPAAEGKVVTRTELPDISGPLEILSDDLAAGAGEASRAPAPAPASQRAQAATKAAPSDASAQRAAGRKVFEAKFKESNPRLPFYITVGVLAAFAIGTVGYFWYQLRPPAPLVNANPSPPANEKPTAIAQAAPAASAAAPSSTPAIPGLPSQATAIPAAPATAAPPAAPNAAAQVSPAAQAPVAPRARTQPPSPPKPAAAAPVAITKPPVEATKPRAAAAEVNPRVKAGYAAYNSGDLARAAEEYGEGLREEPGNRDALLGMAAVDTRAGRFEAAEAVYLRLLQADPRDPHAQAGLLALRAGRLDPLAAESRVKTLLAAEPGAHVLNFALGNQLAQQERWAEAQQEYFKAFAAEPQNADFAYNLAVSLDHMRQPKLALEYYQRAIALAATHGASFDVAAARGRAAQLSR